MNVFRFLNHKDCEQQYSMRFCSSISVGPRTSGGQSDGELVARLNAAVIRKGASGASVLCSRDSETLQPCSRSYLCEAGAPGPPATAQPQGSAHLPPTPGPRGRARVPETPPAWTQDSCPSLHLFTVQTSAHPASLGGEAFQTVVRSPAKQQGSCEAPFQLGPRRHTWLPDLGGPIVHLRWGPEPPHPTLQGPGVSPPASSSSQQEGAPHPLMAQGYAFFPRKPTSLEASSPAALYFLFHSPSERRFLAETLCVCV